MATSLFAGIEFFDTVNRLEQLPSGCVEVAFAGRSNAGKSSAINALARRNRLAYVSKTPGRTQHINYFRLSSQRFLVDLPGYGYANVPEATRRHWQKLLSTYLQTRQQLCGLILLMDVRHPLQPLDQQLLDWFTPTQRPVHILLTKADKLSRSQAQNCLMATQKILTAWPNCTIQLFSSLKKQGLSEVENIILNWFNNFHS